MTTGMPELGSKISLISKADIRYEGRLFTVDPQECTIALASVRSFGTEERETQFPVPAQNQVYDYILFRGSDIKDIRVVNSVTHAQPLNDPAIMQLSVPPTMAGQQFQTHPVLGHMGAQMGQFGGAYGAIGPMAAMSGAMAPGLTMQAPPGTLRSSNSKPTSVLDLIGGGTRSTTPASVASRKSPTIDQGVQAGSSKTDKKVVKPIQPPGQRGQQRNKSRERRDSSRSKGDNQDHRQPQQTQNQHVTRQPNRSHQNQQNHQGGVQGSGYHQTPSGGYQGGHHQGGYQGNHQGGGYHGNQQGGGGGGGYQGNHQGGYQGNHQGGYQGNQPGGYQGNQQQRGGWVNRGPIRARGRPRGTFKPNQGQPHGSKKNTLKFDNDYDFEQANTEFEELKNKLAKVKLDEASAPKPEINGDVDKKDDSGNETGAGETEQEEDHEVYYDKNKSFFDKISCEAVERAKGKCQRTDWRVERKLNSETFGVAATRRGGYYSYRGRGGFRGMGYRGGYRGAYRHPQRRDPNQQQQPQQQSMSQSQQQQQGNAEQIVEQSVSVVEKDTVEMICVSTGVTMVAATCSTAGEQTNEVVVDGESVVENNVSNAEKPLVILPVR